MCKLLALFLALGCLITTKTYAEPDQNQQVPDAITLQNRMWQASQLQDFKMEGFLHVSTAKKKEIYYPVTMRTKDRTMIFEFQEVPLQIRIVFTPDGSVIQRRKDSNSEWQPVTGKDRLARVLDSDISYEDLGLEFFRWGSVKPIGADNIMTMSAWCYESTPPMVSNYSKIRFWISSEYLAVLRADAYNAQGQVIKRVNINGVMKVEGAYTIKEMMMSTMMPGRDLSESRTYIEIRDAQKGQSGL